ncbi:hypothetical protein SAMN04515647_4677 [Cohaesibacter sp. ES.047]|nr:hypothetical protein SAMN04515647_4677 [Cohaesibacter sp. ES.047]
MFMFSRAFERMIQSREQEARRLVLSHHFYPMDQDLMCSGDSHNQTTRSKVL